MSLHFNSTLKHGRMSHASLPFSNNKDNLFYLKINISLDNNGEPIL